MPRPTDVNEHATAESRRKGAIAANAKRRELALTHRERIAIKLEERADQLVNAAVNAAEGGDWRAYIALMEQTFGKPPVEVTGEDGGPVQIEVTDARERLVSGIAGIAARSGEAETP